MKRRTPQSSSKRRQRIYEVALAGIMTALSFLLLALSMLVRYGSIGFFFIAALGIVIPIKKGYYFPTIAAYVASSLLCLAMPYDIMMVMGFIFYFGPLTIASIIMYEKKVKWFISYPIKLIYMAGSIAFLYYVAGNIFISADIIGVIPFWTIELVGLVGLLLLDIAMTFIYISLAPRICKVIRDKNTKTDVIMGKDIEDEESPFEEDKKDNNGED